MKEEQDNIQLKNNHILQLTKDIQSLNQQLLEAQENERIKDEELNTSQVECNDLRYQLRSRKDNKSQTIQDFEGLQSLAKRYKEERDQAKTTIKSMEKQLGSCKREVEKLNKTNAHEQIKALRSDVKSKGTMLAKSRGDVNVVSQWLKDEHGITWPTGIKMKELKAKYPKAKMDKGLEEEIATSEQEFQQVLTEQNEAVASIPSTVNRVETMEWSDLSNSSPDEDDDLPPPLPIKSKENVNPPETNLEKKITELVQVLSQKRDDEDQLELSINRLEGSERETNYKVRPNDLPKFDGKNTKAGYASNITEFLEKCHTKAALGKIPLDFMAAMMTERIEGNIKLRFNIWRKGQLENSDDWALTWNNFSEWLKDKAMSETSRKMKKATLASLKQGKKTVSEYAYELEKLAEEFDLNEEVMAQQFFTGIDVKYQVDLIDKEIDVNDYDAMKDRVIVKEQMIAALNVNAIGLTSSITTETTKSAKKTDKNGKVKIKKEEEEETETPAKIDPKGSEKKPT